MKTNFKIITVVGTRPEMIRLSKLINAFDHDTRFEHLYIHTGQNDHPQLRDVFYQDLKLRKPNFTYTGRRKTRQKTIVQMQKDVREVLVKENPDAFLVLGDTDSVLTAYVAKELNIPIFHLEAGNRCFDSRSPEEANRKTIDKIADFNLTYSIYGKQHLLNEKISSPIFISGSPLYEVLMPLKKTIHKSNVISKFGLESKSYFIWSTHRAEHIEDDEVFNRLIETLQTLAFQFPNKKIIVTTHPRFQKKLDQKNIHFKDNIIFYPPFGIIDYLSLEYHSACVLSDSGTIHEEADIIGFHAVHLRRQHERQEAEKIPVCFLSEFQTQNIIKYIHSISNQIPKKHRVLEYQIKEFSKNVRNYIYDRLLELKKQKG
jgi:UDP-N-acetylglucosamine 2-epimerase (non-hydrolysing)